MGTGEVMQASVNGPYCRKPPWPSAHQPPHPHGPAATAPRCPPAREVAGSRGPGALADAELLALLLRTGIRGKGVLQMAHELLQLPAAPGGGGTGFGGIAGLLHASDQDLRKVKGLGPAKRAELLAVVELARRGMAEQLREREVFASPGAVKHYLQLQLAVRSHEVFAVLFLDVQNRLLAMEELFRGTLTQTSVYPREVVLRALHHQSAAVVLAHNHPSGSVQPSRADESADPDPEGRSGAGGRARAGPRDRGAGRRLVDGRAGGLSESGDTGVAGGADTRWPRPCGCAPGRPACLDGPGPPAGCETTARCEKRPWACCSRSLLPRRPAAACPNRSGWPGTGCAAHGRQRPPCSSRRRWCHRGPARPGPAPGATHSSGCLTRHWSPGCRGRSATCRQS